MECVVGSNIALHINDNEILCYNKDMFRSVVLGHSYFESLDYLFVQGWIRAMLLPPTNIELAGLNVHHFLQFFPGVVRYEYCSYHIVPCHWVVELVDVFHHFIVTIKNIFVY